MGSNFHDQTKENQGLVDSKSSSFSGRMLDRITADSVVVVLVVVDVVAGVAVVFACILIDLLLPVVEPVQHPNPFVPSVEQSRSTSAPSPS